MTTRKELMAQTETIRGKAIEELDRIRKDVTLSDDGRRRQLAKVTLATRQQLDDLKAKFNADREGNLDRAAKRLFGPPVSYSSPEANAALKASYRDAIARADAIQDRTEAERIFRLAGDTGDEVMMRALAATAVRRGWRDIVGAYGQTDPHWLQDLGELEELEAEANRGPTTKMAESMGFSFAAPSELHGVDVDRAARDDTPRTVPVGGPIPPRANI